MVWSKTGNNTLPLVILFTETYNIMCHSAFMSLGIHFHWLRRNTYYDVNSSTHGQMVAISQTSFSKSFPWMKIFVVLFKFCPLFLRGQLTISQHWFRNVLVPCGRQAITWTNADPVHWCIDAALGRGEISQSLWPNLLDVIDCCLMLPSHYPGQGRCVRSIFEHLSLRNFLEHVQHVQDMSSWNVYENISNCQLNHIGYLEFKVTGSDLHLNKLIHENNLLVKAST